MSSVELQSPPSGWLVWYGRLLEGVVMALMVILFLEVMIGVVFRMAGHSLSWYDEVASILLAWLTFYGSALASLRRSHIGCPEIVEQLSPGWRRLVGIFSQCLVIVFFATLAWVGFAIMPILMWFDDRDGRIGRLPNKAPRLGTNEDLRGGHFDIFVGGILPPRQQYIDV